MRYSGERYAPRPAICRPPGQEEAASAKEAEDLVERYCWWRSPPPWVLEKWRSLREQQGGSSNAGRSASPRPAYITPAWLAWRTL